MVSDILLLLRTADKPIRPIEIFNAICTKHLKKYRDSYSLQSAICVYLERLCKKGFVVKNSLKKWTLTEKGRRWVDIFSLSNQVMELEVRVIKIPILKVDLYE